MDWNNLRYFLHVERAGGLTGAARALGVSVQTVGRRIAALEAAVGASLFVRAPGGYAPTPDGRALLEEARGVEEAVARFAASAGGRSRHVEGTVRVAAPETLATRILIPALRPLLVEHPLLHLEMVTGVAPIGIARGEADIALRLVAPDHGALTVRRVGTMMHGLYSAPGADGEPATTRLVGWTEAHDLHTVRWLHRATGRAADVRFNQLEPQRAAIAAGLGIGILPCFLAAGLTRLPSPLVMEEPLWLVTHAAAGMTGRIRLIYDALAAIVADHADALRGENGPRVTHPPARR